MAESPREERQFPIQSTTNGLRQIPWAMIAPHEAQAKANHDQDLETLACRQGLCACEAMAVLKDRKWVSVQPHENAEALLREMVDQWRAERPTAREERIAALLKLQEGTTPGPWTLAPHPDDAELLEVVADYSELPGGRKAAHWIAECDAGGIDNDVEKNKANAALIAAAPDLLAELSASRQREEAQAKELLFFRDTDRYMEWCDVRVLERAEAAEAQVAALHEALRKTVEFLDAIRYEFASDHQEGNDLKAELAALLALPETIPKG